MEELETRIYFWFQLANLQHQHLEVLYALPVSRQKQSIKTQRFCFEKLLLSPLTVFFNTGLQNLLDLIIFIFFLGFKLIISFGIFVSLEKPYMLYFIPNF